MSSKAQNPAWLRRTAQDASKLFQGHPVAWAPPDAVTEGVEGLKQGMDMAVDRRLSERLQIIIEWAPGGFLFRSGRTGLSKFFTSPSDLSYYLCLFLLGSPFMDAVSHPHDGISKDLRMSFHTFLRYISILASEACAAENVGSQGGDPMVRGIESTG